MKLFVFVLPALLGASLVGCGADSRPEETQAESKVVSKAQKSSAVGAFLRDPIISAELETKAYATPQALTLLKGTNLGHELVEFLVATQYDDTPPGLEDASFSKLVAAKVFFPADESPPTVDRVEVRQGESVREAASSPPSSNAAAIDLFNADPEVAAALSAGVASAPEAVLISRGTSFGANVDDYLVASRVDTTPDNLDDGQQSKLVSVLVHFPPDGAPTVSFAEIVRIQ
jgi:hypothetical protein